MDATPTPIRRWIVLFSGFLQHRGDHSGISRLWSKLHATSCGHDSVVLFFPWSADTDGIAEWMFRCSPTAPRIILAGYSFGAQTACNLAGSLKNRGIGVESLVFCDAVRRTSYRLGWWRSLFPAIPIIIPSNVGEVWQFRQTLDWPRGHRVAAAGLETVVHSPAMLARTHKYMDDAADFHQRVAEVAA